MAQALWRGIVAATLVFSAVISTAASADGLHLLTFQELMMLRKDQRVAYIKDVRASLVILERMKLKLDHLERQNADARELNGKIAEILQYLSLLPAAYAEIDDPPVDNRLGRRMPVYQMVFPEMVQGQNAWTCVGGGGNYEFNADVGTCVRKGSYQNNPMYNVRSGSCEQNERPVYVQSTVSAGDPAVGVTYCAPVTSLDYMSTNRMDAVTAPGTHAQSLSPMFANDGQRTGYQNVTADVVLGNAPLGAKKDLLNGDPIAAATDNGADAAQAKAAFAPQSETKPPPVAKQEDPQPPEKKPEPQAKPAAAKAPACAKLDAAAQAKLRKDLKAKSSKDRFVCINAGNFQDYLSDSPEEDKCRPTTKASISNVQYFDIQGNQVKDKSGKAATSCQPNTELCAPEIFCDTAGADDSHPVKVFCAPTKGADPDVKAKAFTKICQRATQAKSCDIDKLKGPTHEEWNKIRGAFFMDYSNFCDGNGHKNFQGFFCEECRIIEARLSKWGDKASAAPPVGPAANGPAVLDGAHSAN